MDDNAKPKRGFAGMSPERRREIARMGGASVPADKRTFSVDRKLAIKAGQKGGAHVTAEKRAFSRDAGFAAEAGRAGGAATHRARREQSD